MLLDQGGYTLRGIRQHGRAEVAYGAVVTYRCLQRRKIEIGEEIIVFRAIYGFVCEVS